MRVVCSPYPTALDPKEGVAFSLFQRPTSASIGRIGVSIPTKIRRVGVYPDSRAWDFLAISLSVAAADHAYPRGKSPDGWTRDIQLEIAVIDPDFWSTQQLILESALRFLTSDIWRIKFLPDGTRPPQPSRRTHSRLTGDSICLLSGGMDSLIGAIDAIASGKHPILVSQISKGDSKRQRKFAREIGPNLSHLQLSHGIMPPGKPERSQRARSIVFIAFGVLAASMLPQYRSEERIELLIPENGFISLNIPLTPLRIGSLSTRTTHPFFIRQIQKILDACDLHVQLSNPYQFKTKGEMLVDCTNQDKLARLVFQSTSCGRFARFGYTHCGRCVPCLIRRAAILHWSKTDQTSYEYDNLSSSQDFDDVRSVLYAIHEVEQSGVHQWAGSALNYIQLGDTTSYADVAKRGLDELRALFEKAGVL